MIKKSVLINSCVICIAKTNLCANETDLNAIQSIFSEMSCLRQTWKMSKEHVEACRHSQHIDWLWLFLLTLIKAPFLSDDHLSFFMVQSKKVFFHFNMLRSWPTCFAIWLNEVALYREYWSDSNAAIENNVYKLNIGHVISVYFCEFIRRMLPDICCIIDYCLMNE